MIYDIMYMIIQTLDGVAICISGIYSPVHGSRTTRTASVTYILMRTIYTLLNIICFPCKHIYSTSRRQQLIERLNHYVSIFKRVIFRKRWAWKAIPIMIN